VGRPAAYYGPIGVVLISHIDGGRLMRRPQATGLPYIYI